MLYTQQSDSQDTKQQYNLICPLTHVPLQE